MSFITRLKSYVDRYAAAGLILGLVAIGVLLIAKGLIDNLLSGDEERESGRQQAALALTPAFTPKPPTPTPVLTPPPPTPLPTPEAMEDGIREIGSRLELFVDDWLIDEMSQVSLRMHRPAPREVVFEFDRPWEGQTSNYVVVAKEGESYRMWYRAGGGEGGSDQRHTAYAVSEDGVHWRRPDLGIVEYQGSRENNILFDGQSAWNLTVFKDGNPEAPFGERYKAIARGPKVGGRDTLRGFVSPDGLHWEALDKDPILEAYTGGGFDSHNVGFWDAERGEYVAYMRGWLRGSIRSIRRSVSKDFRNWSEPEFIDLGNSRTEQLYTNAATPYFRAPHIYLMFPHRFLPDRKYHEDWPYDGLSDGVFMTSRDGEHWDRRFMEAFVRPGPDPDNWSERNMIMGVGVVPTGPGEISVYYVEHYRRPSVRLRRATLRTDGFVSVNAPYKGGWFVTRPLTFEGHELVINYATSAAGSLRVEVQDANGNGLSGFRLFESVEIYGDEIEHVVTWLGGSDVSALSGQPVRLRFVMKDADLYSIRFR